jgi:hypothetical protein
LRRTFCFRSIEGQSVRSTQRPHATPARLPAHKLCFPNARSIMGIFSKAAIDKKYVIEKKELGSGNFAVVKKATLKSGLKAADIPEGMGNEVAVKIIDKAKVEDMNDITREIDVMGQLKHANVIKVCPCRENPAPPLPHQPCALALPRPQA